MTVVERMQRPTTLLATAVFLLGLIVYGLTLPPTLSFWDCGEYIATSHILGIPHQPGTPLYVLMGRTFDVLLSPFTTTAVAVNFMSGFFSALAVMFLYLIIVNVARRSDPDSGWLAHAGGLTGALFLMFSETFWNNAIEAEVYGLSGFIVSSLTWVALKWYDVREQKDSQRLIYLIVYMLGLGVGFHLGSLLVYPGIFLLILLSDRKRIDIIDLFGVSAALGLFMMSTMIKDDFVLVGATMVLLAVGVVRAFGRRPIILAACGVFLLGISVHLFMMIRAGLDPAINQTQPDTFETLMSVLRREQYPTMKLIPRKAELGWQIGYYYNYLFQQFSWLDTKDVLITRLSVFAVPMFLAFLGVVHGLWRSRKIAIMLLVNYLINGEILNFYLNFSDHEVRERDYFFSSGFLFFALFIGLGAAALPRFLNGPLGKSRNELGVGVAAAAAKVKPLAAGFAVALILIAAAPVVWPGHVKWFEHDRTGSRVAHEYAWNLLAGLDPDSVVFTNGDNDTFPLWYLQEVEGFRRDVTVVNLSLINLPWYIKQMKSRTPAMPCSYSDREVDELRATRFQDPDSGAEEIVWVKDYITHDIINTAFGKRPIFFAVTIPLENMERYYDMLQMEGLAYRFTGRKVENGLPSVNAERMLANMYGVYDYSATLSGDSQARRAEFAAKNGLSDALSRGDSAEICTDRVWDVEGLWQNLGDFRTDIHYSHNATYLAGNYPAGLIRAGLEFLNAARETPMDDDEGYKTQLRRSMAAYEVARSFDPTFLMMPDVYPSVLVELGRVDDAITHLDVIAGRIPPQDEESALLQVGTALTSLGYGDKADEWIERRLLVEPERLVYYQILFKVRRSLNDLEGCREVQALWTQQFGRPSPEMAEAIELLASGVTNPYGPGTSTDDD